MLYYVINLWDCGTPSFVSSTCKYFGTEEQLEKFKEKDESYKEEFPYEKDPFDIFNPKEVMLLKEEDILDGERHFIHKNVWECDYKMYYKSFKGKLIYFKDEIKYYRALLPVEVENFAYYEDENLGRFRNIPEDATVMISPIMGSGWGNKNIFSDNELYSTPYVYNFNHLKHSCHCLLAYVDKVFDTEKECLEDKFNLKEDLAMTLFINDFFADG